MSAFNAEQVEDFLREWREVHKPRFRWSDFEKLPEEVVHERMREALKTTVFKPPLTEPVARHG